MLGGEGPIQQEDDASVVSCGDRQFAVLGRDLFVHASPGSVPPPGKRPQRLFGTC
jgi:hypothetical protein